MEIAVGMTGASVVDRDKGSRDQAGMQHGGILGMKAVQPLCQKPDDLTFGNLDTDIVQQGRQSLDDVPDFHRRIKADFLNIAPTQLTR
jgi:hypothetical protein